MTSSRAGCVVLWAEALSENCYLASLLLLIERPRGAPRAEAGGGPGGGIRRHRQASGCRATLPASGLRNTVVATAVAGVACGLLPPQTPRIRGAPRGETHGVGHPLPPPPQLPPR